MPVQRLPSFRVALTGRPAAGPGTPRIPARPTGVLMPGPPGDKRLLANATRGSKPFGQSEIKRGYRKVKGAMSVDRAAAKARAGKKDVAARKAMKGGPGPEGYTRVG